MLLPLDGSHDRAGFDCGVEELNLWLRDSARQHAQFNIARTIVALPRNIPAWHQAGYGEVCQDTILGFLALSSGQVIDAELKNAHGRKMPRSVPVARLGRLAVDLRFQRQQLGETLLMEAVRLTLVASRSIGIAGIFVDAKPDAVAFYEKYGFIAAKDSPDKLWLALDSLR